ncbi:MAG: DUF512 domain-containing protein [Clostridiales bacterium]|nr:DUF512 domain-containing protein [Clostridiales bacterium]
MNRHVIKSVEPGSIAEEMEIEPGDVLLQINEQDMEDIFDYHYLINDDFITVLIEKQNGEEWELEIEKDYQEDLGIEFEQGLMDDYRSCQNKCMFCFIDQMPPGMRETLYFKDDDTRLSFLQGNYVTLTNLSKKDMERIIRYHLSPINISVHTMNPELRCKMLHNRFAGEALQKIRRFYEHQIEMNAQIVLCKGFNDGEELDRSIKELSQYMPYMESLSVVPVGLTKYRDNLTKLELFGKEDSRKVLAKIHQWQEVFLKEKGTRFVFASDEWYLKAELPIPDADYYEGYGQIENGVGMIRSLIDEVQDAVNERKKEADLQQRSQSGEKHHITIATGVLAAPVIQAATANITAVWQNIHVEVIQIYNDFFGRDITVAGLLTGQDIIHQLEDVSLGEYLLLPDVLLRSGEEVLLDDLTVTDVEKALQTPVHIVKSDGASLVDAVLECIRSNQ